MKARRPAPPMTSLHILGICGTFMGGLAKIAREAGHTVTGCDAQVYPPMSEQLRDLGIGLHEGYDAGQLERYPADLYVVGNAMTRGKPVIEEILNRGLPYVSGPQWLAENVLPGKWVLAVAGTHGKTTTAAMLAWILAEAGLNPGFLIGGVPTQLPRLRAPHRFALLRDRGRRVRHGLLRQALQVRLVPAAHGGAEQPRVRPRRHLSRPGGDRDAVSPPGAHGSRPTVCWWPTAPRLRSHASSRGDAGRVSSASDPVTPGASGR